MPTVFINGSSRKRGNTAILGERFLDNFPHQTYHLVDYRLNFVHDHRGTDDPQKDLSDDYEALMAPIAVADTLVLGTPVYWYDMSGQLKVFLDRWFDSYTHGFNFAGKRVFLLVVGADDPTHKATGITTAVQESCDWLKMDFMGSANVTADDPHDVAQMPELPADVRHLRELLHIASTHVSRETT